MVTARSLNMAASAFLTVACGLVMAQDPNSASSSSSAASSSASTSSATTTTSSTTTTSTSSTTSPTTATSSFPSVGDPTTGINFNALTSFLVQSPKYDKYLRPNFPDAKEAIAAQFRLNSLFGVDPSTNGFTIDLYLQLSWVDPRLKVPGINTFNEAYFLNSSVVWVPDIIFYNEHDHLETVDETLRLNAATGTFLWRRHFVAYLTSPFDLHDFPFDSQTLSVQIVSYSYSNKTVQLSWVPDELGGAVTPDPKTTFSSTLWQLYDNKPATTLIAADKSNPNTLYYSGLTYYLYIRRDPTTYIIKYILPLFFVALCSCFTYWVDVGVAPARVGFGVSLLLATITLNFVVSSDLPNVNYATKMDFYVISVFIFVFVANCEYALVHYLKTAKHALLSLTIERFFRYATVPALVGTWLVITYGTGTTTTTGGLAGGAVLLALSLVVGAALAVLQYFGDAKKAKKDA